MISSSAALFPSPRPRPKGPAGLRAHPRAADRRGYHRHPPRLSSGRGGIVRSRLTVEGGCRLGVAAHIPAAHGGRSDPAPRRSGGRPRRRGWRRHGGATVAAGGKRLPPVLVFVAAGEAAGPGCAAGARGGRAAFTGVTRAPRRPDAAHGRGLSHGRSAAGAAASPRRRATCCSRRAFAEPRANGRADVGAGAVVPPVRRWPWGELPAAGRRLRRRRQGLSATWSAASTKTARLFEAACRAGGAPRPALAGRPGWTRSRPSAAESGWPSSCSTTSSMSSGPVERTGKRAAPTCSTARSPSR